MASLNFDAWPAAFDEILVIEFSGLYSPGESSEKFSFVHRALVLDQAVNISFVRDVLSLRQFINMCSEHSPRQNGIGLADMDERYGGSESTPRTIEEYGTAQAHGPRLKETIPKQYAWMLEDFDSSVRSPKSRWKHASDAELFDSAPPTHRSFPILSYRRASLTRSYLQDSNRTTYPIIARPRTNKQPPEQQHSPENLKDERAKSEIPTSPQFMSV